MTFEELAEHGDLGLGTLNGLDGEMIALDGRFYRADVDGMAEEIDPTERTPFAAMSLVRALARPSKSTSRSPTRSSSTGSTSSPPTRRRAARSGSRASSSRCRHARFRASTRRTGRCSRWSPTSTCSSSPRSTGPWSASAFPTTRAASRPRAITCTSSAPTASRAGTSSTAGPVAVTVAARPLRRASRRAAARRRPRLGRDRRRRRRAALGRGRASRLTRLTQPSGATWSAIA